ncbi:MAG: hypothetical protein HKO14_08280 [Silicimonas sp.]|nr:hypothetical protein [Silicimonas sp.]
MEPIVRKSRSQRIYLSIAACVLCAAFFVPDEELTRRIFGALPVPVAVVAAAVAGSWALDRLPAADNRVPWRMILVLGALFLLPIATIDLAVRLPEDLNMPPLGALAFYPVAGFVAESVFHLLPLGALALFFRWRKLPAWAYIPAVLSEPVFQAVGSGGWTLQGVLVAVHVAAFSAAQLWVFRAHGFAAMYALRLSYYVFWHLLWGILRLELLF